MRRRSRSTDREHLFSTTSLQPLDLLLLAVILGVAAFLRFYGLGEASFSNDELSALYRLRFDSLATLIEKGVKVDGHPAFTQVLLYYWKEMFGTSEVALRFPFALAGVLAVFFGFRTARIWGGTLAGLLTAGSLAVLEFPLLYARIARPYGLGLFFILLFAFYWSRFVLSREKVATGKVLMLGLSGALCLYTHYFCAMTALVIGVGGLFLVDRKSLVSYLLAGGMAGLLFLPHVPITWHDLQLGGVGEWLGKPDAAFVMEHLLYIFNGSWWLLGATLAVVLVGVLIRGKQVFRRGVLLFLLFFGVPFLVGYVYSLKVEPVLQHSTLLFSMPFLLIFLFSRVREPALPWLRGMLVLVLLGGGLFHTIAVQDFYEKQHFGEFRGLAEKTLEWQEKYGEEQITRAINLNAPFYIHHYLDSNETRFSLYKAKGPEGVGRLATLVDTCRTPYFLYGWSTIQQSLTAYEVIREKFPVVVEDQRWFNARITLFSRRGEDERKPLFRTRNTLERVPPDWERLPHCIDSTTFYSPPVAGCMDGEERFSTTFRVSLGELTDLGEKRLVTGQVQLYSDSLLHDVHLVMDIHRGDSSLLWRSSQVSYFPQPDTAGWFPVHLAEALPDEVRGDDVIGFYVWNPKGEKFLFDDLELQVFPWEDPLDRGR